MEVKWNSCQQEFIKKLKTGRGKNKLKQKQRKKKSQNLIASYLNFSMYIPAVSSVSNDIQILHTTIHWRIAIAQKISDAGNKTLVMKLLENLLCRQNEVIHAGIQPNQLELYPSTSVINSCNIVLRVVVLIFMWRTTSTIKCTLTSEKGTINPLQAGRDKGH